MRIFLLILLLSFMSCRRVPVKENEVLKYSDIIPFVLKNTDFKGSHDIDLGILYFNYKPTNSIFSIREMDSIAENEKWKIKTLSTSKRLYLKEIKSFPDDVNLDSLFVYFDGNRIFFEWH